MGSWWISYSGMVLVPCEWAAGGPVILVWNWCCYGTSARGPAVLV